MARVAFDDADKYGGKGGTGFFQLKDDGDKARVRFMYNSIEDVVLDTVHEVPVLDENGDPIMTPYGKPRTHYVNCLRESYNSPVDDCPFCREKKYQLVKLFIPVYNLDENMVQIWERGKTFQKDIGRAVSKHPDTVSQVFEIERVGEKGDKQTKFYIDPVGKPDGTTLEDLPPLPEVLGTSRAAHVWDKTADEMEYYLEEGEFPPTDDDDDYRKEEEERPVRRRNAGSRRDHDRDHEEEAPARSSRGGRRTPARRKYEDDEDVY